MQTEGELAARSMMICTRPRGSPEKTAAKHSSTRVEPLRRVIPGMRGAVFLVSWSQCRENCTDTLSSEIRADPVQAHLFEQKQMWKCLQVCSLPDFVADLLLHIRI